MAVGHQFSHLHEFGEGGLFPHDLVAIDAGDGIEHAGFQHEKAAIDPGCIVAVPLWLFHEIVDL